jgi:hypothetical protein
VRPPFDLTGLHGQQRLPAIQRLHLRFLIDAEDRRMGWRMQIQPDDAPDLFDQERLGNHGGRRPGNVSRESTFMIGGVGEFEHSFHRTVQINPNCTGTSSVDDNLGSNDLTSYW